MNAIREQSLAVHERGHWKKRGSNRTLGDLLKAIRKNSLTSRRFWFRSCGYYNTCSLLTGSSIIKIRDGTEQRKL